MAERPDPYATVEALVANALTTARVVGESTRIVSLVVSSVGRLAAELDAATASVDTQRPGRALVAFALDLVTQGASPVPRLQNGLAALLDAPISTRSK